MYKSENWKVVSRFFLANIRSHPEKKSINILSIISFVRTYIYICIHIYNGLEMTSLLYSADSTDSISSACIYIIFSIRINRNIIVDLAFTFFSFGFFLAPSTFRKILSGQKFYRKLHTLLYIWDSKLLVFRMSPLFVFRPVRAFTPISFHCIYIIYIILVRITYFFFLFIWISFQYIYLYMYDMLLY